MYKRRKYDALDPEWGMDTSVWSYQVEACRKLYQMPKYECFLKYLHLSEKKI